MNYSTVKKYQKIRDKLIDTLLFPVRCICTPFYKLYKIHKKKKRYSDKQIRKTIQYLIDYWTDNEEEFYIITDIEYNPFHEECNNIKTLWDMYSDMGWGYNGENKKIKNRINHMYFYQKEQYLKIFKELCLEICGASMTLEDKKKWLKEYIYLFYKIKEIETYKIK